MESFVGPAGSMDMMEKNNPASAWNLTNLILCVPDSSTLGCLYALLVGLRM